MEFQYQYFVAYAWRKGNEHGHGSCELSTDYKIGEGSSLLKISQDITKQTGFDSIAVTNYILQKERSCEASRDGLPTVNVKFANADTGANRGMWLIEHGDLLDIVFKVRELTNGEIKPTAKLAEAVLLVAMGHAQMLGEVYKND